MISTTPPAGAVSLCGEYLPEGTRVRLQVDGPGRLAIEEQRKDELAGRLVLLGPHGPGICRAGLGATTGFGVNLCDGTGQLRSGLPLQVTFDDLVLTLSRWSAADAKDPAQEFFASRGARPGARFALMTLKNKGIEWTVWLRSSSEMVSECIATFPGKNNVDSFPMVWKLQSRP